MNHLPKTHPAEAPVRRRRLLAGGGAAALLGSTGLAGCGGGSDETATPPTAPLDERRQPLGGVDGGGTGRRVATFVAAAIDLVQPLTVNGVRYDTGGSALVDADGAAVAPESLRPGMRCRIEATTIRQDGGTPHASALSVRLGEQLLGPLSAGVDSGGTGGVAFDVLGQPVTVTARTLVDETLPGGVAALQPGQLLTVWGELDRVGHRIVATRIDAPAAPPAYVVRGVLARLDRAAGRARIGALELRFDASDPAVVPPDLALGAEVRARLDPVLAADGVGVLRSLRDDAVRLPERVEAELEGRVTRMDTPRRFEVDGVPVEAVGANASPGLVPGARVAVHGRSVQGVLLADRVVVEPDEPTELEGAISSTNAADRSFVVRGVSVSWNAQTRFEGGPARLLTPRRKVAVLGRWSADHTRLVALRIHVEA